MAQTIQIPWTTGTGNITLTVNATSGNQTVQISSSPNPLYTARQQVITFTAQGGSPVARLTVTQERLSGAFDASFDKSFRI